MSDRGERIIKIFEDSVQVKEELLSTMEERIASCAGMMVEAIRDGGKILLCGNGGSAAEAMHFASELVGKLWKVDRPAIHAVALTTDPCIITSLSNDYGFAECFVRQVEGLGREGDILIGITTSGNSANVIRAIEVAKQKGMKTIGILGGDGGKVMGMVDDYVRVPSKSTPRIQESHHLLSHVFASIIEEEMYGETA